MIVMTLNCRGLDNTPKKLAIRRMIEDYFLDVIFMQETMCDGSLLVGALEIMITEWKFVSVDSKGKSRGFDISICLMHGLFVQGSVCYAFLH